MNYSRNYYHQQPVRRTPEPNKPRWRPPYYKVLGVFVCLFIIFNVGKGVFAADTNDSKKTTTTEPAKRSVDTSQLASSIDAITKKYPYNTSVSVVDLNSGKTIQTGDTYPFIAASTTKLLTALVYLHDVEEGSVSLDSTIIAGKPARKQLELMINQSDNAAWKAINNELTKESLSAYAQKHGVTSYDAESNKVTANDMAQLIAKLYKRELINDQHSKLLLSWMRNTSEERFIPAAVPQGLETYHKAGYLADRVHDVAIVDNGSAPFVIVIYSKTYSGAYDYTRGQQLYKQITQQVVTTFK